MPEIKKYIVEIDPRKMATYIGITKEYWVIPKENVKELPPETGEEKKDNENRDSKKC